MRPPLVYEAVGGEYSATRPLNSPLLWYGGKQRMTSKILPLIPPHTVYTEPFCGGAAVMFAKGRPFVSNSDNYREVINDTNEALITFYAVAQNCPDALLRMVEATPYSKALYDRARNIYKGVEGGSQLEIAWAVYLLTNCSFAGKPGAGWAASVVSQNRSQTWAGKKKLLAEQVDRLDCIAIDCADAIDFIHRWDSPHTCHYIDPPYPGVDQGHYKGYSQVDFVRLIDTLEHCQSSFVLSCYANPAVPDHWPRYEFAVRMSAAHSRDRTVENTERTEVVWVVDRSENTRDDLKPLLWRPVDYQRPLPLFAHATNGNGHSNGAL